MTHGIHGEMAYSFEKPMWHTLGKVSTVKQSAEEIVEADFGGGYTVRLEPITLHYNGMENETGDFGIVRGKTNADKEEKVFGYVTGSFHPVQLMDVARTFDNMVGKPVETMAVLNDGALTFITWNLPSFDVVGFEHLLFGAVSVGLDNKRGASLFTCNTRIVCWNTLCLAEGEARETKRNRKEGQEFNGMIYKGTKTNPKMIEHLGYWMKAVNDKMEKESSDVASLFQLFAKTPVKNEAEVHEILYTAFPPSGNLGFYPAELRTEKEERMAKVDSENEKIRDGVYALFSGGGTAITPDYYGLFNSVSEYYCHVQASKKPIAQSVMFGNRADAMKNVVNVLRNRI